VMGLELTVASMLIKVVFSCSSVSLDCLSQAMFHSAHHPLPPSSPPSCLQSDKFPYYSIMGEKLMGLGGG
jgi:hypothetical protein